MKPEFGCKTCGRPVQIKDDKLSCCGVTESVEHARAASRIVRSSISRVLFDPVIEHYDDDGEVRYEGIPNT